MFIIIILIDVFQLVLTFNSILIHVFLLLKTFIEDYLL